jgi:predicted nucleic acid-binding Zn ribbon protein
MSRTSKYYNPVTHISRLAHCQMCGADLEHSATGRPKRFCSTRCRLAYHRAMKRHAAACVDAALAGEPEPPRDYGQPIKYTTFEIDDAGNVTKQARPERVKQV